MYPWLPWWNKPILSKKQHRHGGQNKVTEAVFRGVERNVYGPCGSYLGTWVYLAVRINCRRPGIAGRTP